MCILSSNIMKKKLIFITTLNYDTILFEKLDFQKYINSKDIETEFWKHDVYKKISEKKIKKIYEKSKIQQNKLGSKLKKFSNQWELLKLLKTTNKNCFIYDFDYFNRSPFFSLLLKLYGARLIFHGLASFPIIEIQNQDIMQKIKNTPIKKYFHFFIKTIRFFSRSVINKFFKTKLDIFFYNGNYEKSLSRKISKKAVSLFTRDYERYLVESKVKTTKMVKEDYILFLDQGYPVPYDNYFSEENPVTTEEKYKNGILNFLNSLKKLYKQKKIIVALHPNSERKNFFGFESYEGCTNQLVKHASFVVSHDSLSLQFVALWKKPCLLLFNDDMMDRLTKKKEIEWFKKKMPLETLNIDSFNNEELKKQISSIELNFLKSKYDNFISEFITNRTINEDEDEKFKSSLIIDEIKHYQ